MNGFSPQVGKRLKHYVYKLIDPRNGQTFYVGRGQGNRVFAHVNDELKPRDNEDELPEKLETIKNIRQAGLEVIHVIHRHGMKKDMAKEVEAALIDATPGLTNVVSGYGSNERGPAHVKELSDRYGREVIASAPQHKFLVIKVKQDVVYERGSLYEAVRWAWVLNPQKARKADYVLAIVEGVCSGVFVAESWEEWKKPEGTKQRYEFHGCEAPHDVADQYVDKLIPDDLRKPGMANPVLFWGPFG